MNYWIVAAIIFAYLLIGLGVDSWINGADSPIKRKNVAVWLLWPVTIISLLIGIARAKIKVRKFNKLIKKMGEESTVQK